MIECQGHVMGLVEVGRVLTSLIYFFVRILTVDGSEGFVNRCN